MSNSVPTPVRPYREDIPWRRHKPAFTMLACLGALIAGALLFAWQYKAGWTPLQRYYFAAYFRTAHVAKTQNRYLRPARTREVLVIQFRQGERWAVDRDVVPVTILTASGQREHGFRLTRVALGNGARSLRFESLRLDDGWFHAWLAQWIYGGQSLWQLCRNGWYASLLVLALTLPFGIRQDRRQAQKRRSGIVLRGANLTSLSQYHRANRRLTGVGWLTCEKPGLWEWIFMPKGERRVVRIRRRKESEHFLLAGNTGVGKSSLIRQLLFQIRDREETAIIYDPAQEYLTQFYDPDRDDIILCPLDARMPYWSPSDEIIHMVEADTLAKSLYPDRTGEQRFFVESPRKIFAHLLQFRPKPEQLYEWVAKADPEIYRRLAWTPLEEFIGRDAPSQKRGVLSGLERISSVAKLLPRETKDCRRWTATEWVDQRKGWIFLPTSPETRECLKPVMSLILDFLILRLTAQNQRTMRPVWLILDELPTLDTLPTLPLALAESRKANLRLVLGFQGRGQLDELYGTKVTDTMLSACRTRIFLRATNPEAAKWASDCIGEVEKEHVREGRSASDWGVQSSTNAMADRKTESAILRSEIADLEDLVGYFKTPGYTMKLTFPLVPKEENHPAQIWRDPPELYALDPRLLTLLKQQAKAGERAESPADEPPEDLPSGPLPPQERTPDSKEQTGDTHPVTTGAT
jgi:Type IV secretion-system coupling protein DNA-binding domain